MTLIVVVRSSGGSDEVKTVIEAPVVHRGDGPANERIALPRIHCRDGPSVLSAWLVALAM